MRHVVAPARARSARSVVLGVAAALVVSLLAAVPARAETAVSLVTSPDPEYCAVTLTQARSAGVDLGMLATGRLRIYGEEVPAEPIVLATPPFTDPSRALWYRSLAWVAAGAVAAHQAGDLAGVTAWVDRAVGALAATPDPGSATPESLTAAVAAGWDGGTNFQRQRALVCLRSLVTGRPELTAAVETAAAVNLDERRYYGPPLRPAHNHGTQANLVLLDSARLLGRPDWRAAAVARLVRDVGVAFEGCGMTFEQSLPYIAGNVRLWQQVPPVLRQDGLLAEAAAVERRLARADVAIRTVTAPDGRVPVIGDGGEYVRQDPGWARPTAGLLCRATGWAARHLPKSHYVLRFGPARAMHGHADHGSIVWWDRYPVLSDPGAPGYADTPESRWSRSNQAHSVVSVSGVPFTSGTMLRGYRWSDRADTYYLTDVEGSTRRARQVVVLPLDGALLVVDSVVTDRRRDLVQRWQLATGWRRETANTFSRSSRRLRIDAFDLNTGRQVAVGRTLTPRWSAPLTPSRNAYTAEVRSRASALRLVTVLATGRSPVAVRVENWSRSGGVSLARVRVGSTVVAVAVSATGVPSVRVPAPPLPPVPPARPNPR